MANKKDSLEDFVKSKEKLLTIIGIFLAVLPIAFSELKNVNVDYAGYFAMFALVILALLFLEIFRKEEEYSTKVNLFILCLLVLGIILFLTIKTVFEKQTMTFFEYGINTFFIILGVIAMSKLSFIFEKNKKRFILNLFLLIATILIIAYFTKVISFISNLFLFLPDKIHFYLGLFVVGFIGTFLLFGIFVSGIEVILINNIWKFIKEKTKKVISYI